MGIESHELREYLLGALSEEAATVLDERLFSDAALCRDLQHEQESLIHDFVDHTLPLADEALFRAQCARSPALQAAVDELRSLKIVLARERDAGIRRKVPSTPWVFAFAAAAIALCVVSICCLNLLHARNRLKFQVAALSRLPSPAPISVNTDQPLVKAFLSANVLRGDAPLPSVAFPPGASRVELQVEVHAAPGDNGEQTVVVSDGSKIVWRSLRVPFQQIGQETFFTLVLDRTNLPPGLYQIQYAATTNPAISGKRSFRVAGQ